MNKNLKKVILGTVTLLVFIGGFIYFNSENSNVLKSFVSSYKDINLENENSISEVAESISEVSEEENEDSVLEIVEKENEEVKSIDSNDRIEEVSKDINNDIDLNIANCEEDKSLVNEYEDINEDTQEDINGSEINSYSNQNANNEYQQDTTLDNTYIIEEVYKEEIVIGEEIQDIKYEPIGSVNTDGKLIFEYDNVNIVYLENYSEGIDKYIFYVWDRQQGWVQTIAHTTSNKDTSRLSMEKSLYGYTDDVDVPEDRIYQVKLVIYPHKDRRSEEKCSVYNKSGELIVSKPVIRYNSY